MWDTILPKSNCSWEPVELRILKQELANMACKCRACESFRSPSIHIRGQAQCHDEAIQVNQKDELLNKYIYANSDIPSDTDEFQPNSADYLRKNTFCPNCYFIWDLLRRAKKVFKDEDTETKPDCSDKSTEKSVKIVDSSTSAFTKPALKPMSSNLTICDFLSDCSIGSLSTAPSGRKSSQHDRVTFLEDFPHVDFSSKVKPKNPTIMHTMHSNCFCLETFIDAIRPPLNNVLLNNKL